MPEIRVLHTCRWCVFAGDALRHMKGCYAIVVIGLRGVPLRLSNKQHSDALLFALTNEVFCVLFSYARRLPGA